MNEVKTFRAASMQEALSIVRRELGADAVILHTRQLTQKRLLPFLKPKEEVEVTAGTGVNVRTVVTRAAPIEAPPVAVPPSAPAVVEPDTPLSKAARLAAELERRNVEKQKLEQSLKALEQRTQSHSSRQKSQNSSPAGSTEASPAALGHGVPQSRLPASGHDNDPMPRSAPRSPVSSASNHAFGPTATDAAFGGLSSARSHSSEFVGHHSGRGSIPAPAASPASATPPSVSERASNSVTSHEPQTVVAPPNQAAGLQALMGTSETASAEITSRLDALQKMVESLTRTAQRRNSEEVPAELFEIYTHLIDADIEDQLARELIFNLRQNCSPEQLHDPVATRALMTALVEKDVRIANPIRPQAGRRRVVALVGPTGVGKTTTIAKLAANFRLRDGVKMGLVTVDTYRIAAVEQLRTYAEIIDLPMKVVTSPQEMRRALDDLIGLDLVLIDTAGRSPRDELKIQELKQMLSEAGVDEVHLVMSLTASAKNIRATCEQFRAVNPTALVLTKLDEAAGMGSLLSVAREVGLPFSYLTTGQDVPEDIEPANAQRIARLVLGQDRLFA